MHTTQIIREAFGTILAHPWTAIRATVGPLLLAMVPIVLLFVMFWNDMVSSGELASSPYFLMTFVVGLLCFFWAIVAWHRAFLLGERPGLLPKFHLKRILHYIWCALVVGVLSSLCALPFALFALPLVQGSMEVTSLDASAPIRVQEPDLSILQVVFLLAIGLLASFAAVYVFLRLSPVLPATAIGRPVTCGDAWAFTRSGRGSIALLALAYVVVLTCLGVVWEDVLAPPLGDARVLVDLVGQWIVFVISLSVITTIYRRVVIEADGAT